MSSAVTMSERPSALTSVTRDTWIGRPEHLFSLRELDDMGYGCKRTNLKLINDGVLPAVKVGNTFKVRERDLPLLAEPVGPAPTESADLDDLAALAAQMVASWPALSAARKAEIGRLLATRNN